MKTTQLTLMTLALAAAIPAFAQNTTESRCGETNYDRSTNSYTIVRPMAGVLNQQCFITVVPKSEWTGGSPDMANSRFVEGNYNVALSGGGGGGAGGADGSGQRNASTAGGDGGDGALAFNGIRYFKPGVYRVTIGAGGLGGEHALRGIDGAPTSVSDASTGQTIAGFPRAEYWDGTYPQRASASREATGRNGAGNDGATGNNGGGTAARGVGDKGDRGGNGFVRLALADAVPVARVAPAVTPAVVQPAPVVAVAEPVRAPVIAAPVRAPRRDRN
jgi:hypothetical protein